MSDVAAVELAQVWVPLMPEASRLAEGVRKIGMNAERVFGRATKTMGAQMATAFEANSRKAVDSLRDVEKYTTAAAKAKKADEDATGRLALALKKQEQVANNVKATDLQRATAAEGVARAQRAQELTATNLTKVTKQLETAQKAQNEAQEALKNPGSKLPLGAHMADRGAKAGLGFVEGFAGSVGVLGRAGGPIGAAIAAVGTVALAGGTILGRQVLDGMDKELRRDAIAAKMGADPTAMARVGAAARTSFLGAFGNSIEENMDSVRVAMEAGLLPRDATTGQMTETINQLSTVATILGEDVPQAARGAGQMIKTGMAASAKEAADILVWGQQRGLNVNGDLIDSVNEYSTQFRKLGMDGRTAMVLVSQMVAAGARDTDVAADSLKEFSIRVVDGSKTTTDAMTAIGLDAATMAAQFAQGGPTAKTAFAQVVSAINSITDPVKRSQIQVALFGTQAEDLGAALSALDPERVADGLNEMTGASQRAADTMADNAATSIESAKRAFEVGLDTMQTGLAGAFSPMLAKAAQAFSEHTPQIIGLFTTVAAAALDALHGIGAFASGATRFLSLAVKGFNTFFTPMIDQFSGFLSLAAKAARIIPGMADDADTLEGLGAAGKKLAAGLNGAPGVLDKVAQGIDDVRAGLPDAADQLRAAGERAQQAAQFTQDLGDAATKLALVDGRVTITDNTEAVLANIDRTQYEITHLDDGTVELIPRTEQATAQMQAWRDSEEGNPVDVPANVDTAKATTAIEEWKRYIAGQGPVNVPVAPKTTEDLILPPAYRAPSHGGRAAGGYVDSRGIISGPGSGRSDSILARVVGAGVGWFGCRTGNRSTPRRRPAGTGRSSTR